MYKNIIVKVACLSFTLALSGCFQKGLVYNENFPHKGPMYVVPEEPAPAPEPIPEPVPEPTLAQLNERAIKSFTDLGLEAEQTDRGVSVYLPPEIYFGGSAANIDLQARTKIAEIAAEVKKDYLKDRLIEVVGHTDSTGSSDGNMRLSKERAKTAAGELVFSQVERKRLITVWKGDKSPRYSEVKADGSVDYEGRAKNRRVEFTILNP